MKSEARHMDEKMIKAYQKWLIEEEKSDNTVAKYLRDVRSFYSFLPKEKQVDKQQTLAWKEKLEKTYAAGSMNSMLVALNGFLQFAGWEECRIKLVKCQRRLFCVQEKELTKAEYLRLVGAAKLSGNKRLYLLIETICATGIRVSELSYITVEAAKKGRAEIYCKGKLRIIFLPEKLCRRLLGYVNEEGVSTGYIFRTKKGNPINRSNIWHDMKGLCKVAGVEATKVYPHNLRHLFARSFYELEKHIAKLADILGHSSIETTRIYIISSGEEHAKKIARLGLII